VDYLYSLGSTATKARGRDYWYLSPLRDERKASFKINRNKNVWYDPGAGSGGTLTDFAVLYFKRDVQVPLEKISVNAFNPNQFSFQKRNTQQNDAFNNSKEPPFHLHENYLMNKMDAAENGYTNNSRKAAYHKPGALPLFKRKKNQ
jgi:hypothetical protein